MMTSRNSVIEWISNRTMLAAQSLLASVVRRDGLQPHFGHTFSLGDTYCTRAYIILSNRRVCGAQVQSSTVNSMHQRAKLDNNTPKMHRKMPIFPMSNLLMSYGRIHKLKSLSHSFTEASSSTLIAFSCLFCYVISLILSTAVIVDMVRGVISAAQDR